MASLAAQNTPIDSTPDLGDSTQSVTDLGQGSQVADPAPSFSSPDFRNAAIDDAIESQDAAHTTPVGSRGSDVDAEQASPGMSLPKRLAPETKVLSRREIEPSGLVLAGEEVESESVRPIPESVKALAEADPDVRAYYEDRVGHKSSYVSTLEADLVEPGADTATLKDKPYGDAMRGVVLYDVRKVAEKDWNNNQSQAAELKYGRNRLAGMPAGDALDQYNRDLESAGRGELAAAPHVARVRETGQPVSRYDRVLEAHELRDLYDERIAKGVLEPGDVVDVHTLHTTDTPWHSVRRSLDFLEAPKDRINTILIEPTNPPEKFKRLSELELELMEKQFGPKPKDLANN